ncbi:MAG: peptidase, partial [Streptococcaceae bacterium]|nr:peptidase [Streptococcaceae bacterium]
MKRYQNKIIYALIYIGIILFCALPLPYFIESPGTTEDLRHFVTVDGKKDTSSGSFSLTSVSVSRATGAKLLLAYFNDFDEILSKKDLM